MIREITNCRVCSGGRLSSICDLGEQYIIDFPQNDKQGTKGPLQLVMCEDCTLVQLRHTVARDSLYSQYWYRSGTSPKMVRALADVVRSAERLVPLQSGHVVVDIGANDGTLLKQYSNQGLRRVGFEPAANLEPQIGEGVKIINDYFNSDDFFAEFPKERASVVTSVAMFYDLDDPNEFVADVHRIMDPNGLFLIQMNYLGTMIEQNTFDNICHEHLEYYSLRALSNLLERHDMEILDVELNDVNGGSFRTFVRNRGSYVGGPVSPSVSRLIENEEAHGLNRMETYVEFGKRIAHIRNRLFQFVSQEVEHGKKIFVNGASTRGNTILQFAGLDRRYIVAAADLNPEKWGRRMVGTWIPIVSKEQARKERPDYYLVLPYGFLDEIKEEEKEYLANGGKFIVPIPFPRIISKNEEMRL